MLTKIIISSILITSLSLFSFGQEIEHIPQQYYPAESKDFEMIHHSYYSLGYCEEYDQAAYVIYLLSKKDLNATTTRNDHFVEDDDIGSGSADTRDYYQSGYDRGHLAPAADMSFNNVAMEESFLLSNISPQHPSFNRGVWKELETLIRDWAYNNDSVYVVTGPVLEKGLPTIGHNHVAVPNYFYKIALIKHNSSNYSAIGFLLKNQADNTELIANIVTVDSIEKVTGIDFFSGIETSVQEKFESRITKKDWNFDVKHYPKNNVKKEGGDTSQQCKGITKTNKQCLRKAQNNSKFCWQHE